MIVKSTVKARIERTCCYNCDISFKNITMTGMTAMQLNERKITTNVLSVVILNIKSVGKMTIKK